MNISQIRKLVSTFSTVGNEMGINPQTLNRDVADIFAGKNVQRTSLGMQLGLTNKDIENAKASAQGLYGFLEDRLSGYAEANENFKNTIEGSWQHLEGVATLASSTISSAFEPAIAAAMNAVANFFGTIEENKETGEEAFKPSPYTYELLDVLIRLGTYIASVIDWVIYAATSMEEWYSSITGGCDILDDMCTVLESVISFVVYSITIFAGFGLIVLRVAAWCGSAFPRIADLIRAVVASINAVITAAKEMWAALHGDAASVVSLDIKRREYVNQANKLSEEAINYDPTSTKNDTMGSSGGGKLTNEFRAFIADFKAKLGAPSKKSSINPDDIQSRFPPAEKEDKAKKKAAKEALQEAKRHYEEQKEVLKNALEDIKEQIKKQLEELDTLNKQGYYVAAEYYSKKEALEKKQAEADIDYYQKLIALTQATPYEHETDKQKELLKLQRSLDKCLDSLKDINKNTAEMNDVASQQNDMFGTFNNLLNKGNMPTDANGNVNTASQAQTTSSAPRTANSSDYGWIIGQYNAFKNSPYAGQLERTMGMSSDDLKDIISLSVGYGVDSRLATAVAMWESNGNSNDTSPAGAVGMFQLMPDTAASLGVNPYDNAQNIQGGIKYLAQMLKTFDGDTTKALAAYNAGPQAVKDYNGIPPYKETQLYVPGVLTIYEYLKSFGVADTRNVGGLKAKPQAPQQTKQEQQVEQTKALSQIVENTKPSHPEVSHDAKDPKYAEWLAGTPTNKHTYGEILDDVALNKYFSYAGGIVPTDNHELFEKLQVMFKDIYAIFPEAVKQYGRAEASSTSGGGHTEGSAHYTHEAIDFAGSLMDYKPVRDWIESNSANYGLWGKSEYSDGQWANVPHSGSNVHIAIRNSGFTDSLLPFQEFEKNGGWGTPQAYEGSIAKGSTAAAVAAATSAKDASYSSSLLSDFAKSFKLVTGKRSLEALNASKAELKEYHTSMKEFTDITSDSTTAQKMLIIDDYSVKWKQAKDKVDSAKKMGLTNVADAFQKEADSLLVITATKLREVDEKQEAQVLADKLKDLEEASSMLGNKLIASIEGYKGVFDGFDIYSGADKFKRSLIHLSDMYKGRLPEYAVGNVPTIDLSPYVHKYASAYFDHIINSDISASDNNKYDNPLNTIGTLVRKLSGNLAEEQRIGYRKQFDTVKQSLDGVFTSFVKTIKNMSDSIDAYFDHQSSLIDNNKFLTSGQKEAFKGKVASEKAKSDVKIQEAQLQEYQATADMFAASVSRIKAVSDDNLSKIEKLKKARGDVGNDDYAKGKLTDKEYQEYRNRVEDEDRYKGLAAIYTRDIEELKYKLIPTTQYAMELNKQLAYTPTLLQQVGFQAKQSLEDGLLSFLTEGVNETKSLGEAFRSLIVSMLKDLQKLFAKKLINDFFNTTIMKKWFPNTDRALEPERMSRKETYNYVSSSSPYTNYGTRASNNMLYGVDFSKKESVNAGLARANTFSQYAPKPTQTQQIENGIKDGYKFNNKLEFSRIYKRADIQTQKLQNSLNNVADTSNNLASAKRFEYTATKLNTEVTVTNTNKTTADNVAAEMAKGTKVTDTAALEAHTVALTADTNAMSSGGGLGAGIGVPNLTIGGNSYATGGFVSGAGTDTSDSIPSMLSNNEFVVKASAVRKYGTNFLDAVNSGTFSKLHVAKFATGGKVGGTAAESTARGMETFGKQIGNNASFTGNYNLILATNQEEATKAFMESPAGQRVLLRFNQNQAGIIHRMGNY